MKGLDEFTRGRRYHRDRQHHFKPMSTHSDVILSIAMLRRGTAPRPAISGAAAGCAATTAGPLHASARQHCWHGGGALRRQQTTRGLAGLGSVGLFVV